MLTVQLSDRLWQRGESSSLYNPKPGTHCAAGALAMALGAPPEELAGALSIKSTSWWQRQQQQGSNSNYFYFRLFPILYDINDNSVMLAEGDRLAALNRVAAPYEVQFELVP